MMVKEVTRKKIEKMYKGGTVNQSDQNEIRNNTIFIREQGVRAILRSEKKLDRLEPFMWLSLTLGALTIILCCVILWSLYA